MEKFIIKKIDREVLKKYYFTIISLLNPKYRKSLYKVKNKFIDLNEQKSEELRKALLKRYDNSSMLSETQKKELDILMNNRIFSLRHRTIPWLDSLVPLEQCNILEIGCSTGCTTVVLAEQGCKLTSIDVSDITIAKKRCELYGVSANIIRLNATSICELGGGGKFDIIIFSDSMEHMTYKERISAIKQSWHMLKSNGYMVVIGSPNRLHYYDRHSSFLHFYHWLPDEIAMQYSKYSPRDECANIGNDETKFIRFGRGVSYHEFEIALDIKCSKLECYCMQSFLHTIIFSHIAHLPEYKFKKLLKKFGPSNIPDCFYYEELYIAIKKSNSGCTLGISHHI